MSQRILAETLPHGITIAAIDTCFDEVVPQVPRPFMYTEPVHMPEDMQVMAAGLERHVLKCTEGDVAVKDRALVGFLFGHRLLRECVPDYRLMSHGAARAIRRLDELAPLVDITPEPKPELQARFADHPEVLEHLFGKLSNDHSRLGLQVCLLYTPRQVRLEPAAA